MTPNDLDHLQTALDNLRYYSVDDKDSKEELANIIDWLNSFINNHPITILRRNLIEEAQVALIDVKHRLLLAEDGVKQLKHLQKYEGHAKAESDNIAHNEQVRLLNDEIVRLRAELERLSHGQI
jgi:hypothetical protein